VARVASMVREAPEDHRRSLAHDVPPAPVGTLHLRATGGLFRREPERGLVLRFGRGHRPDIDVVVGADDMRVSRLHGALTYWRGCWWLRIVGREPVRLPDGQLVDATSDPVPLAIGYTPLFVTGSGCREHLVELYVTGFHEPFGRRPPRTWPLDEEERLVLVVLGQDYLRHAPEPRPLPYPRAAVQLGYLCPAEVWGARRIALTVAQVVERLARGGGFPHPLKRRGRGAGNDAALLHNLLRGLVAAGTLVPPDLALLDDDEELETGGAGETGGILRQPWSSGGGVRSSSTATVRSSSPQTM
jgi:hypothetical protein